MKELIIHIHGKGLLQYKPKIEFQNPYPQKMHERDHCSNTIWNVLIPK